MQPDATLPSGNQRHHSYAGTSKHVPGMDGTMSTQPHRPASTIQVWKPKQPFARLMFVIFSKKYIFFL